MAEDSGVRLRRAAWAYELAHMIDFRGNYSGWRRKISLRRPVVPEGSARGLRALYEIEGSRLPIEAEVVHLRIEEGSTLSRGDQIEDDYFRLKVQEFGPMATESEIRSVVVGALVALIRERAR